ncbi:hypothetical protein HanIR_Chr07g0326911 [Helianthus annuus]|nr:hypothetical protein HanIR_Chr07g0326911 [Helianthus annuus]
MVWLKTRNLALLGRQPEGHGNTQVWGRCAEIGVKVVIGSRIFYNICCIKLHQVNVLFP